MLFYTTAHTLLKVKDTFFYGLLYPNDNRRSEEDTLFIDRDGEVFKYVLEYLIYGKLISVVDDGILGKLLIDADYYQLPELVKLTKELIKPQPYGKEFQWCSFRNASISANGGFWSWNTTDAIDQKLFNLSNGPTYNNDTLKILQPGLYHIIIRTACTTGANYYTALYENSTEVARCYSSSSSKYRRTFHINEIRQLSKDRYLQVYQTYDHSPLQGDPYNVFQVIRLSN